MGRDLLQDCGAALYGPRWQTALSHDLGVSDRTIRRWASGVDGVPPGVWGDVLRLMRERVMTLDALAACLVRQAAP